jgi:hypothetical protein
LLWDLGVIVVDMVLDLVCGLLLLGRSVHAHTALGDSAWRPSSFIKFHRDPALVLFLFVGSFLNDFSWGYEHILTLSQARCKDTGILSFTDRGLVLS